MKFAEDKDKLVCFVNSNVPPDNVERLNLFRYTETDQVCFFELCRYSYCITDGVSVTYTLLEWEEIYVPNWKVANFKLVCDAMKSLGK